MRGFEKRGCGGPVPVGGAGVPVGRAALLRPCQLIFSSSDNLVKLPTVRFSGDQKLGEQSSRTVEKMKWLFFWIVLAGGRIGGSSSEILSSTLCYIRMIRIISNPLSRFHHDFHELDVSGFT